MPSQTPTDRIARLEQSLAKAEEQIINLREAIQEVSRRLERLEGRAHDAEKESALLADRFERLEKGLEGIETRRWEVWKIVLTGALSGALGLLIGRLLK